VRLTAFALVLLLVSACGPQAGRLGEPFPVGSVWASPARPALDPQADTNDANAYHVHGISTMWSHADTAAAAFYWATRLDPWRADAYYARAVALMRTLWVPAYGAWRPTRPLRENEVAVIDSLNRLAYSLNPYIDRRFDYVVGPPAHPMICERVRDPVGAGVCFLQAGSFSVSLQRLNTALKKDPKQIQLHYVRAHAYYRLGHFDSAAVELGVLADSLGQRQEKTLTAFYVSRATIYYAQGMAYTQRDDTAAARAAYERALVEDLGFHMASIRLAGRALSSGDTTTALNHMAHAVAVSPTDAPLRMYYGIILSARNQSDEARDQFLKAIEINPDFAQPYMHLAQEIEKTDLGSAVASYETFLLRSAKSDSSRAWVERRLQRLMQAR
jgi:Tfp pilus assembly protein PilF